MDVLHQAYPHVPDVFLELALSDADGDVIDALESMLINVGDPLACISFHHDKLMERCD